MLTLQESLKDSEKGFSVYSTDRVFIREGEVSISSDKEKPQDFHYFLFNDIFLYCKSDAKRSTFRFKGVFALDRCLIVEIADNESKLKKTKNFHF